MNQWLNHKLIWDWDKISSLLHIMLLEVFGNIPHRLSQNAILHLIGYQSYVLSLLSLITSWFQYQPNQWPPLSLLLMLFSCHTFLCGNLSALLASDASSYSLTTKASSIFLPGYILAYSSHLLACIFIYLYPLDWKVLWY